MPDTNLLASTREFLVALTTLLYVDVEIATARPAALKVALDVLSARESVPPHLSFSEVPAIITEGWTLLDQATSGHPESRLGLAKWISQLARLGASIDVLHAAGAVPETMLASYQALIAQCAPLVEQWNGIATPARSLADGGEAGDA